ncbi:recombination regulator RecX [Kitasatospora sp. NBC_01250]|uniref:recombination regulator RecX n=1 Tax=Kitasatospora sp. NBC_01250 TaxID=2903571 RepID=UPI003FA610BE
MARPVEPSDKPVRPRSSRPVGRRTEPEARPGRSEQPDWVAEAEAELAAASTRGRRRRSGRPERGAGPTAPPAAEADPAARARDICLRLLTGTPRTRGQLATALRKREIPDEVAEEVLSRFEEVGLIDDAAFAAAWVESRHHGRGLARRALARELRTRGVAGALVEEAVAQLDPDEEAATARALVERKLRATTGLERQARLRRLVGMLARRGYSEGLAFRVVREVLDAEGESTEELEEWSLGSE